MYSYPSNAELAEMVRLLSKARMDNWLEEGLGTWRWWVLFILLFLPWIIWSKYVDKKNLPEISLYGTLIMLIAITLDELGFVLSLWTYPVDVIPMFPRLTSIDYSVVPVIKMFIYQYFSTWKSFTYAIVIMAVVFSFIAEPLIVYLGFYQLLNWNYVYSFIIYILMALLARWLVKKAFELAKRA